MKTEYIKFYYMFKNAIRTGELDKHLIYNDDMIKWLENHFFDDLAAEAKCSLQTRSYPEEIENYVKETIKYLYDNTVEKVDASQKHIPSFLLK